MTTRRKEIERRLHRIVARIKGGPRHPLFPLPLLPSGPGGVHSFRVTRDHKLVVTQVWRRERDSNPRYLAVHTLSKRAPSATRSSLPSQEVTALAEEEGFEPPVLAHI